MFERWKNDFAPCYIIAEIGVNHNGDEEIARRLIEVAADAGADAVKFQTFKADKLATRKAEKAAYQNRNDPRNESQADMLRRLEFPDRAWGELKEYCSNKVIDFLSTPFDEDSVDLLAGLGVHAIKVSSGDLTNLPLLRRMASKGLPIILSTGMGNLAEVSDALQAIEGAGDPPVALLHCVSVYPADPADANLAVMKTMAMAFGRPVGWSDHTLGEAVSLAAVSLGARIIEKHFTLSRDMEGPDHKASLEPEELKSFVANIRSVEAARGSSIKKPTDAELETAKIARRSVVAASDIEEGAIITEMQLAVRRPATGIEPKYFDRVVGRRAASRIEEGDPIEWGMLA